MKVITTFSSAKHKGIFSAIHNVFNNVQIFSYQSLPAFDLFDSFRPDLVFCDIDHISENFIKGCNESGAIIVLFGDIVPPDMNVTLVCPDTSISPIMKKNIEINNEVQYIYKYANIDIKYETTKSPLSYDIGYISNTEQYSNHIEMFLKLDHLYKMGICGNVKVPIIPYFGSIKKEKELWFLRSCKIALDINGDNLLDNAINRIFTISTIPNILFPNFHNDYDLFERFLKDDEARQAYIDSAYNQVASSGTNYHILLDILGHIGISSDIHIPKIIEQKL